MELQTKASDAKKAATSIAGADPKAIDKAQGVDLPLATTVDLPPRNAVRSVSTGDAQLIGTTVSPSKFP